VKGTLRVQNQLMSMTTQLEPLGINTAAASIRTESPNGDWSDARGTLYRQ